MTLAVLNDIIEGKASKNISLFSAIIMVGGRFPGTLVMTYTTFNDLVKRNFKYMIHQLYVIIDTGSPAKPETIDLILSGGKRKKRNTRKRGKNNNTKRRTRRRKH